MTTAPLWSQFNAANELADATHVSHAIFQVASGDGFFRGLPRATVPRPIVAGQGERVVGPWKAAVRAWVLRLPPQLMEYFKQAQTITR